MNPELSIPAAPPPSTQRNVLTLTDYFRLGQWARDNRELCADTPNTKLAIIAGASLDLTLTASNIASTLEAAGITKNKPDKPRSIEERFCAIEEKLALMTGIIQGMQEGLSLRFGAQAETSNTTPSNPTEREACAS